MFLRPNASCDLGIATFFEETDAMDFFTLTQRNEIVIQITHPL
jgi:hypothetical protein